MGDFPGEVVELLRHNRLDRVEAAAVMNGDKADPGLGVSFASHPALDGDRFTGGDPAGEQLPDFNTFHLSSYNPKAVMIPSSNLAG